MITYHKGDILKDTAMVIVIPVNCVGVMGAGLALQAKRKWPLDNLAYVSACRRKSLRPGEIFGTGVDQRQYRAYLATKDHWRDPSKLKWIDDGLHACLNLLQHEDFSSIAIPPVGCGLGGLEWNRVHPLILETFKDWNGWVRIYPPKGGTVTGGSDVRGDGKERSVVRDHAVSPALS